jgi:hypothetical protein
VTCGTFFYFRAFYHLFTASGLECGPGIIAASGNFTHVTLPAQCAISSGWQRINCCHINVCYAADFALTGVSAPPAGWRMANQRPVMSPLWPAIGACLARSFMRTALAGTGKHIRAKYAATPTP